MLLLKTFSCPNDLVHHFSVSFYKGRENCIKSKQTELDGHITSEKVIKSLFLFLCMYKKVSVSIKSV